MPSSVSISAPEADAAARRGRRKQARPGELLDAALHLFVEKGYAATRVEEVAARAGVSKGTLFLYFPSKEELFQAVVRENISGRFEVWGGEIDRWSGSTADMLHYALDAWWQRIGATPASGITKLMISEAKNFPDTAAFYEREVIVPGKQLIRRILQRGIDRGEFDIPDLDYAVYLVIAPMIFLFLNKHSPGICVPADQPLDPARYVRCQADTLLAGFTARAPKARR